ncbi:type IV pilus assembly protein FimV [Zooshikella sp. RANM57]|uniref:type IV pilus assembly protein FimV n=1 Tax=Zooshikella sp. RANM57 TaxID=3425863 RepID=UPI003D6E9ADA
MRFQQALAFVSFGCVFSSSVLALGLGRLDVKSSYGEPLNAQLELIEVGDLTKNEIIAKFASADDIGRLGTNRNILYSNFHFDVTINQNKTGFIKITTDRPIKEPSVDLFVSLIWPNGKLVRKYEVSTELPAFVQRYQNRYDALVAKHSQPVITEPFAHKTHQPIISNKQFSSLDYYYVQENDTLMEIAAQMRPSTTVSLQQTMIAIYRENPHAFINNNINLLKKNIELKLPKQSDVAKIPYTTAVASINKHHRQWQDINTSHSSVASTDRPATTSSYVKPENIKPKTKKQDKARLKIVTQENASSKQMPTKKTNTMSNVDFNKLQNQLTSDKSELAAINESNRKSFAKLKDLERRIQSLKRRIKDKDDKISTLQSELGSDQ